MSAKKKVLGRGLDLLIPEGNNTKQSKTEKESKPIIKEVVKVWFNSTYCCTKKG